MGVALATFLLFGVLLVLPGSSQAPLAASLGLDLADTGLLAAALSGGLGVGVVGAGPLVDRLPRRPLFALSAGLASGILFATAEATSLLGIAAGLAGAALAIGVLETGVNAVLAIRYGGGAARALAAAHSAVTLGAVAAPIGFALLAGGTGWQLAFRGLGTGFGLLALGFLAMHQPAPSHPSEVPRPALHLRRLLALGGVSACYVGFETSLTIFAVPFATGGRGLSATAGLAAISGFWLGLGVGRVLMAAWGGALAPRHLILFMTAAALLLAATLALPGLPPVVGFAVVGAALGGAFPLLIALAMARAPGAEGTAGGFVAGCGSLGGFAVPWLTGILADARGPALAVASLALWALAAAVIAAQDVRRQASQPL